MKGMNPFFQNLEVTYFSTSFYNDTNEDQPCQIELPLQIPLVKEASKYVLAVERMELSGNNIAYYSAPGDPDNQLVNGIDTVYMYLYAATSNPFTFQSPFPSPVFTWIITGRYFSLNDLLIELNRFTLLNMPNLKWRWCLESGGEISFRCTDYNGAILQSTNQENMAKFGFAFGFSSSQLASIFGMPVSPSGYTAFNYYLQFGQIGIAGYPYVFKTRTSRIDAGSVPMSIVLRSNFPLESDQVGTAKANIVTDFSIAVPSQPGVNWTLEDSQVTTGGNENGTAINTVIDWNSVNWSGTYGSLIVYVPNERRWLNFSAPVPINYIRFWIQLALTDGTFINYNVPPGGRFNVKVGLWLRNSN